MVAIRELQATEVEARVQSLHEPAEAPVVTVAPQLIPPLKAVRAVVKNVVAAPLVQRVRVGESVQSLQDPEAPKLIAEPHSSPPFKAAVIVE